ncbi:hypothetical protein J4457_06585 [Candidatus Woesearchaeota archaeon]|nr:hypothetical protein [Candidatus Woesearchaeota archaeon]
MGTVLKRGGLVLLLLALIPVVLGQILTQPNPGYFGQQIPGVSRVNHQPSNVRITISDSSNHEYVIDPQIIPMEIQNVTPSVYGSEMIFQNGHFPHEDLSAEADYYYTPADNKVYSLENKNIIVRGFANFCFGGVEGQYYATYTNFPLRDASGQIDTGFQNVVTIPAHTVNWDADPQKYCKNTCVAVNNSLEPQYNTNLVEVAYNSSVPFCCGDDINATKASPDGPDCGRIQNNFACLGLSLNPASLSFTFFDKDITNNQGNIQDVDCGNLDIVASPTTWYRCGSFNTGVSNANAMSNFQELSIQNIRNHGYACAQSNIYECKNATESFYWTSSGAKQKSVGNMVKNVSQNPVDREFYCTEKSTWASDLDGQFPEACRAAGFTWTGTMCCSEQADQDEYYNDPITGDPAQDPLWSTPGGCFDETFVPEGTSPLDQGSPIPSLIVNDGTFRGCNLQPGDPYLALQDQNINPQSSLVDNKAVCSLVQNSVTQEKLYCDINHEWKSILTIPYEPVGALDPNQVTGMHESFDPFAGTSNACCPTNDCWNGTSCIQNQAGSPARTLYNDKTCENGQWITAQRKFRWDLTLSGYCGNPAEECFKEISYNPQIPSCASRYVYTCEDGNCDYYCSYDAEWTTRTKILAAEMKKIMDTPPPQPSYELYCDTDMEAITNYLDYPLDAVFQNVPPGITPEQLLGAHCTVNGEADQPCVSSICVVKYNNNLAVGLTLNIEDIEDIAQSPLRLFGATQSVCTGARDQGGSRFNQCTPATKLWYNPALHAVVYVPAGTVTAEDVDALGQYIRDFIVSSIIDPFRIQIPALSRPEYEFIQNSPLIHAIYFAKRPPNVNVYTYYEGAKRFRYAMRSHIGVAYPNMDDQLMCRYLQNKDPSIICNPPNDYYVAYSDDSNENEVVTLFRNDMMAKLRVP